MNDDKVFFDVFSGFECPDDIRDLFEQVVVTKAILVKSEKTLKLSINSKILIEKKDILQGMAKKLMEDEVIEGEDLKKLLEELHKSNGKNVPATQAS